MTNKRFNDLTTYYENLFGTKVFKISLNGGFSCPNKDGKISYDGCSFCSKLGSGDFAGDKDEPLSIQFKKIKEMMETKWNGKYIAYFQANTNTYASIDVLKEKYEEALKLDPNIIGLSISTRPDSISEECYEYLKELNKRTFLTIELGLQTIHDEINKELNRGHDFNCFKDCVYKLSNLGIKNIVVHIIDGLPGETKKEMLETVNELNKFPISGIKIHLLHIMKDTKMGEDYLKKPFKTLTLPEYVDIAVSQIEILRPDIIIHRLTGDSPKELLIEPMWSLKKFVVLNEIDKELRRRNTYQGIYYKKES